ncbi:MAG: hypothetical protein HC892_03560 [Saprospiraceae bacterium]|nr:hypothetical protein [Saprospiraceae bacterium]
MKPTKLVLLLLIIMACKPKQPKITRQELIEQEVQKKIQLIVTNKNTRCLRESLEEASEIVDSMIIAQAKLNKDTLLKPPKPEKPLPPIPLTLKDSLKVKPFLSDTI